MAENLNAAMERAMADCLSGEFGHDVIITGPNGARQEKSANDPEKNLRGMLRYAKIGVNPETGEEIIIHQPILTLRLTDLDTVPEDGENWFVQVPVSPVSGSDKKSFLLTQSKALEGETDMGTIRFFLDEAAQE